MTDYTREEVIAKVAAGESLERADLVWIDLSGANLIRANLSYANLRGVDLQGAKYNKLTKFPEGFGPEAAGMYLVK